MIWKITKKGDPFNAGEKDEFLLYSRYLDYYEDNETGQAGVDAFDCTFYPDESAAWWPTNNPQRRTHADVQAEKGDTQQTDR